MRKLTLRLENERGIGVSEVFESSQDAYEFVADGGITELGLRLDILEESGPWKKEPWKENAEPNQVFPTKPEELVGMRVKTQEGSFLITAMCPDEFEWEGQKVWNYPIKNKFYGHRIDPQVHQDNPKTLLLCVDKWDLYPQKFGSQLKFFKAV